MLLSISGPQLDEHKEAEDGAKLWFGILDRLVQAQRVLRAQAATRPSSSKAALAKPVVKSEFGEPCINCLVIA